MENNMHLWEIHSSCSFFHIQEESFRSKLAKPQVQDIHIQEEASNVKWKKPQSMYERFTFLASFTYRTEEATDLKWKTTSTRYSHTEKKLQIWHGELHIRKIHSSCSFSHTGRKKQQIWNGKTTSMRYPIFTYTGERSFRIWHGQPQVWGEILLFL